MQAAQTLIGIMELQTQTKEDANASIDDKIGEQTE